MHFSSRFIPPNSASWWKCKRPRPRSSRTIEYSPKPSDQELLLPAVEEHQRRSGRVPRVVAADAGFYSHANEKKVQKMGVSWIAVPNRSTHSEERRKLQKRRWFPRRSEMADGT